jgi:AcrR family transcriptional regulator
MAGRPREFDREEALRKAQYLFWTYGYEGTSMGTLSEELGLASARIYAAFRSKEELFREAIERYRTNEGSFVTRALLEEPTARGAIERMFREAVETYTRRGQPQGCMIVSSAMNSASENDHVRQWLAAQRLEQTASIVKRLRKAVQSGELRRDDDPVVLGEYLAAVMNGLSVHARDGVSKKRLLMLGDLAVASVFGPER